ncbi:MAG: arylsulfatase [Armatimonadetes bacterium]|nr:arylsulfatase [Armatimonadota bacterium]
MTRREAIRSVSLLASSLVPAAHQGRAARADEGNVAALVSRRHGTEGRRNTARGKPNIIFILADDLGYGDLGCYGQKVIRTPNLDQMAAEGLRFTDAYAGSTVCAPSRCALMTGLHTGHCRVRGNALVPLQPEDVTVAELLKGAGYTTGIIGKWGLGEPDTPGVPNRQGFDTWFGYLNQAHAHNYYPEYLWRNEEKVELSQNLNGGRGEYSHDLFTQEALEYVQQHAREPFFLYLAYTIPHANNERGRATGDGMEVPTDAPYSGRNWPQPMKGHAAMITRLDRDIGTLFSLLKDLGIEKDTLVFLTSDNGPHKEGGADPAFFRSSGPLRGHKRDLYEGGIRVPMLARWPGMIQPGVSDLPWAFWDFLPTACQFAGVKPPGGIDGLSVLPTLFSRPQKPHDFMYWEFHERGFEQAVRHGQWKAVRHGLDKSIELYDLAADLGETRNVAADRPDEVAAIEEYLRSARAESKEFPVTVSK